jgi:hypothetical protein
MQVETVPIRISLRNSCRLRIHITAAIDAGEVFVVWVLKVFFHCLVEVVWCGR